MKKFLIIVISVVLVSLLAGCTGIGDAAAAASSNHEDASAHPHRTG